MYDNDLKLSEKRANANRAFVEAAIDTYESANKTTKTPSNGRFIENAGLYESSLNKEGVRNKYICFVETVKSTLLVECMYNIFENAIDPSRRDITNCTIMRAMTSQYVHENGYDNILNKMKFGSVALSEMYNIINNSTSSILESVDKDDPDTFSISKEKKDEFFDALNHSDSQSISDAIKDRVSDAMNDFITANTKEHEDIESALQDAQDKIEKTPEEEKELQESYNIEAKRKATMIRNSPKTVFHCMVTSMCESVLKNQSENEEFLKEGHLDIDKIVDRTSLMYTFMEMLNTSRIDVVNEQFIKNVIEDLKK